MSVDEQSRTTLEWVFDHALDEDRSGFIEERECNMVAKYLGYGKSENAPKMGEVWEQMLKDMDTDGDKRISKEEFVVFMAGRYHGRPEMARDLKDEVVLKKNQHEALKAVYNAADGLDDVEEVMLDGSAAAATVAAAAVPATSSSSKVPVLSEANRKELKAKFDGMDEDGNGMLSKAEIADVMFMAEDDAALEAIWAKADADGDGKVTFDEFVSVADAIDKAVEEAHKTDLPGL